MLLRVGLRLPQNLSLLADDRTAFELATEHELPRPVQEARLERDLARAEVRPVALSRAQEGAPVEEQVPHRPHDEVDDAKDQVDLANDL